MTTSMKARLTYSTRRIIVLVLFATLVPFLFILQRTPEAVRPPTPARTHTHSNVKKPWVRPVYDADLARAAASSALTAPSGRRFVIVTAANSTQLPYVRNLACSLAPTTALLLLALDSRAAAARMPPNVQTLPLQVQVQENATVPSVSDTVRGVTGILATGFDVLYAEPHTVFCARDAPNAVADAAHAAGSLLTTITGNSVAVLELGLYYARAVEKAMQLLTLGTFPAVQSNEKSKLLLLDPQSYPTGCTKFAGQQLRTLRNKDIDALCRTSAVKLIHYQCYNPDERMTQMRDNKMWFITNDDDTKCYVR